jgi:hypothetical protein
MARKKPEKPAPKAKPSEKPPSDWTTEEAIDQLFPKPAIDAVRDRLKLDEPPTPKTIRRR